MKPYCLPIIVSSKAEVLEAVTRYDDMYSYFEVWLDYITDVDEEFVRNLTNQVGERLVLVFRRQNLEDPKLSHEQRLALLSSVSNSPVLVDLDVGTQTNELDYIHEQSLAIKTIASYHNYQGTPDTVHLKEIIDTMEKYQPSVLKLATMCSSPEDALRLLELLVSLKAEGKTVIVLGMGEFGKVTRVFGALWGNEMTFAPFETSGQSAPGQLTRQQLEIIFKEIRG
jgi:3-dehydroquinate dehydratase-1